MTPPLHREFEPKLVTVLREGYSRRQLARDVAAGIQVGIVALPLSLALAIASGVRPEQGLFTAVVAGFLISALGGSRVQVGGPTGAFIVLVYGIVQTHGYDGLAVATMMAGGLMVLMGFARLGNVAIDATGLRALEDDLDKAKADGTQVLMTGVQAQPRTVLMRAGVLDRVGEENVVPDFQSAVERAKTILGTPAP